MRNWDKMTFQRFKASTFEGVTPEMKSIFDRDGFLVLDQMVSADDCDMLRHRMTELAADFNPAEHKTVFSSTSGRHGSEDYFLSSGHLIHFFLEEGATDENGTLIVPKEQALNKVGHALHDQDPVFSRLSRSHRFKSLASGLGLTDALLIQSMYIYKQPRIGGEVLCHQDATYLSTEPESCLAFWLALEDATEDNGCLWGIPGGHRNRLKPKSLFKRCQNGGTKTIILDNSPFDEDAKIAIPAPKGTLIAFNGLFPHLSAANHSDKSRHAYTLHLISAQADYPDDNWLQRPAAMPFKGF